MLLTQDEIRAIQLKQLEVMIELDQICRKHDLTYYLIGGTLLGAVRHQGFIPWDDDLDIAMPRKDYDRFMEIGQQHLSEQYFLQNHMTDKKSPVPFAKVRINGTAFVESSYTHLDCHHGIFVDIFPLDMVSAVPFKRRWDALIRKQLVRIYHSKLRLDEQNHPVLRMLRRFIASILSSRSLIGMVHFSLRRYKNRQTGCLACPLSLYGVEKELMKPEGYGTPVEIDFEGHRFFAPAQATKLLTQVYGDYMQLPPEDQRWGCHSVAELKLS